jgi:hypothetical protein
MEREFVKAPTAEEFCKDSTYDAEYDGEVFEVVDKDKCIENMIEFAKLHVEAALKEASEKGEAFVRTNGEWTSSKVTAGLNKESILNSYPLENIK